MKISVIIPTVDRGDALLRAVHSCMAQTVPPHEVVIGALDQSGVPTGVAALPSVKVIIGARGASAQRNLAVANSDPATDLYVFIDDDTVLRDDFVERAVAVMGDPGVVALTGRVALDGVVRGVPLTPQEIEEGLNASRSCADGAVEPVDRLYGCNMVVRGDATRAHPFDERLALYSWLEDLDFSKRLSREGRLVLANSVVAVHQGSASGGRQQHRRLGYSQVANPIYLNQKGSLDRLESAHMVLRPVLGALRDAVSGHTRAQGMERLRGMRLAALDVMRGHVTPERIISL